MKLGIVCGLQSEKAALGRIAHPVAVSGADAGRAYSEALRLADAGAECLVSIGLAGALMPHLRPGDLLLPRSVVGPGGESYYIHPIAQDRPRAADGASLLGYDQIVGSAEEKARLAEVFGASAVDMESHAVARAAKERHLPVYVIRAVADPADMGLPKAAEGAVAEDGRVRTLATLRGLLSRPGDLPKLIELGRQASQGLQTLRTEGRELIGAIGRS